MKNTFKIFIFTFLGPCVIAGLIPYFLYTLKQFTLDLGFVKYFGLAVFLIGLIFYFWCAASFLVKGGGTPAIWFTKRLSFLIGEEPGQLVSQGLYTKSRNPMYLGNVYMALGVGIFFQKPFILIYAGILFIIFHCTVVFLEEPHLRKKHGASYEQYFKNTPRWFNFKR